MRHLKTLALSFALVLSSAGGAGASSGIDMNMLPDLGFRVATAAMVCFVIWKFAGKAAVNFFTGRRTGIEKELNDIETRKEKARQDLLEVEKRIAGLEKDRAAILADYEARGEALKAEIIAKAEAAAAHITSQAKQTVQNEIDSALANMREELAEKIIEAASASIAGSLNTKDQDKLLNSFLNKVVLQ